jgi:hypothetical protein
MFDGAMCNKILRLVISKIVIGMFSYANNLVFFYVLIFWDMKFHSSGYEEFNLLGYNAT